MHEIVRLIAGLYDCLWVPVSQRESLIAITSQVADLTACSAVRLRLHQGRGLINTLSDVSGRLPVMIVFRSAYPTTPEFAGMNDISK